MSLTTAGSNKFDTHISLADLKKLLAVLKANRSAICFRFRLIGELWSKCFMTVARISDRGLLLKDEIHNSFIAITNVNDIIQFEVDEPFLGLKPYFHYHVKHDECKK